MAVPAFNKHARDSMLHNIVTALMAVDSPVVVDLARKRSEQRRNDNVTIRPAT